MMKTFAPVFVGGIDDGAVAGEIGLAREHVHHLRTGDARHQLHGEGGHAGVRHGLESGLVAVRVHDGDDQGAALAGGELRDARAAHPQHHVGALGRVRRHARAGGREFRIRDTGLDPGAGLDHHVGAEPLHLLDRLRRRGDPVLAGVGLTRNRNAHSPLSSWVAGFRGLGPSP